MINRSKPIAVLGAGKLVSQVYRESGGAYSFNIFRVNDQLVTSQVLASSDLRDLVKLCQVLTFAICDDGWVSPRQRKQLLALNAELDEITQAWSDACDE